MEPPLLAFALVFTAFAFATIGALIANAKRRRPHEGLFLGLFLGPIGVAIEVCMPESKRPMIDEGAWHSFRSMVTYQSDSSVREPSGREASVGERKDASTVDCLA